MSTIEYDKRKKPKKARARNGDPGAAPTRASLHEAALAYLARGAASADSVTRTLQRRIGNWARRATRAGRDAEAVAQDAAAARELIAPIVERLGEVGLVNDTAFAENRAKRMSTSGRSRRAITAHLAQKGVAAATVREAVSHDAGAELSAAIAFARKRRLGPFAREEEEPLDRDARRVAERKALGTMARAGFDFGVCERVLRMDRDDADERLRDRREF
ncbi:MAG TPA: RecX family transcriptional regulator [Labilithrix sp.]|nr:RecX family transcriptional regulator [Labilithrix sp.]